MVLFAPLTPPYDTTRSWSLRTIEMRPEVESAPSDLLDFGKCRILSEIFIANSEPKEINGIVAVVKCYSTTPLFVYV